MSRLAEIRERHEKDENEGMALLRKVAESNLDAELRSLIAMQDDRAHLIDLVARLRSTLVEYVGAGIELDDARMDYIVIQIDRLTVADAIGLLGETK